MSVTDVIKGIISKKPEKFATLEEIQYAMRKHNM